jgi:[NiFe] hydrogenase assembly HybE family chaperone
MTAETIADRLVALYRAIETTAMRDAPICNSALEVEAIGFRDFSGHSIGVVVTSWFLNLVAAQSSEDDAPCLPRHALRLWFPAGAVDFVVTEMEGFGPLGTCSLVSPMFDFPDQDAARAAAAAALDALFDAQLHGPSAATRDKPVAAIDRRAFFTGRRSEQGTVP